MSEVKTVKGKLIEVIAPYQTLEETCEQLAKNRGYEPSTYYPTWESVVKGNFEDYVIYGETIYRIIEKSVFDSGDDFVEITPNKDGTMDFINIGH